MNSDQTISILTYEKSELEKINLKHQNTSLTQYNVSELHSNRTISNPSFLCSLNEKETIESYNEEVTFSLRNGTLNYDMKTVINSCPALTKYFSQIKTPSSKITINLPHWITKHALIDYFAYYKTNILTNSSSKSLNSLLKIADCFENNNLVGDIIKSKIIPTLSYESAILFLQESFKKIDHNNLNFNWYELFTATKEFISIHLIDYIQHDYQKLMSIQNDLLGEIIEYHLILTNTMEKELLEFLISFRQCYDIYELISNEYLLSSSEENYASLLSSTYSILECEIKDKGSFYQEIPKKYNKTLDVIFYMSYKESEDLFKTNFKVNTHLQPKLYSFSFICFFEDRLGDKKYSTVKVVSNLKGCLNIMQINKFKNQKSKKIRIHMKANAIHTHVLQYLCNNFHEGYYNMPGIVKMSSSNLKTVLQIAQANKVSNSILVHALSIWLNDEINMNDDLNKEIIKVIDWKKVDRADMYTFLVKYSWLLDKDIISNCFSEELKIDKELIIGIKECNYDKLIIENLNLKRSLEAMKTKKEIPILHPKDISIIERQKESFCNKNDNENKLFDDSEEGEMKLYLQSNTIDTKESLMSLQSKELFNYKNTMSTIKPLIKSYEPTRVIEFEISSPIIIDTDVLASTFSPPFQYSPAKIKLSQAKQSTRKGRLFRNVLNNNNSNTLNQKPRETSTSSQRTNNTIKTDRSSSITNANNITNNNNSHSNSININNLIRKGKKISTELNSKDIYSSFVFLKTKKIQTTKNIKPQLYKGLNALND